MLIEAQAVASRPAPAPATNLPTHLSKFIGREKEIGQVKARLAENRLVTLTGPGGIGKTRLSIQTGRALLPMYEQGVWLVELAPLADPALVLQTVATVLGVSEQQDRPWLMTLTDSLRQKSLLLVLDNCEHLIDACAQLAEHLLRHCPNVRLLTSSREALGVEGEIAFRVSSLSLPSTEHAPGTELADSEAVQLFVERAAAVLPGFALTDANAPAIAQVCRRLDGIALAIELAAARVKTLKVEQIAGRLDDAFRLLTGGSRTALPRQQTLRATIDWSYNLLSDPERRVFRRLPVFAGGWTLEAAEAICAGEGVETDEMLDLLTQLAGKSLVVIQRQPGQEARYHLLETTRQYAREKLLENSEGETGRERHLAFYLRLAEEIRLKQKTAERPARRRQFETENDNFRAALEWALTAENAVRVEQGLRVASALRDFWNGGGHYREGLDWLEQGLVLSAGSDSASPLVQAKALYAVGFLTAFYLGFPRGNSPARSLLEESIALYRKIDPPDKRDLADALSVLAGLYTDDPTAARALSEESVTICRGLGSSGQWELAQALFWNGHIIYMQGDDAAAQSCAKESQSLYRQVGDVWETAAPISTLGHLAVRQGDYSAARTYYEESLHLYREGEDRWGIAASADWLGDVDRILGDYGAASARFEESLRRWREMGNRADIALSLRNLGIARLFQSDSESAAALLLESLSLLRESTNTFAIALTLVGLSDVWRAQGQGVQAARLLRAAETANAPIRSWASSAIADQAEYDRLVAAGHAHMTEAVFVAAWAEGQAMTLEQAVAYALEGATKFSA